MTRLYRRPVLTPMRVRVERKAFVMYTDQCDFEPPKGASSNHDTGQGGLTIHLGHRAKPIHVCPRHARNLMAESMEKDRTCEACLRRRPALYMSSYGGSHHHQPICPACHVELEGAIRRLWKEDADAVEIEREVA